jgi:hypothetical protein
MAHNLIVTPSSGSFDTDRIRDHLDAQPEIMEAPTERGAYLVLGRPNSFSHVYSRCIQEPNRLPRGGAIFLGDNQIILHQEYADLEEQFSIAMFLKWLASTTDLRVRIDGFDDLTEKFKSQGVESLYSYPVHQADLEWKGELIQLGFFMEVFDSRGGVMGGNLKDCIADTPQEDEDKLVAYLQAGRFYRAFGDPEEELYDVLDHSAEMNLKPALLTDGTYVWATDLPYYVARYHARLPRSFLLHARRNGWQVPQDLDISSLKMLDA